MERTGLLTVCTGFRILLKAALITLLLGTFLSCSSLGHSASSSAEDAGAGKGEKPSTTEPKAERVLTKRPKGASIPEEPEADSDAAAAAEGDEAAPVVPAEKEPAAEAPLPLPDLPSIEAEKAPTTNAAPPWKTPAAYRRPVVIPGSALPLPAVPGADTDAKQKEEEGTGAARTSGRDGTATSSTADPGSAGEARTASVSRSASAAERSAASRSASSDGTASAPRAAAASGEVSAERSEPSGRSGSAEQSAAAERSASTGRPKEAPAEEEAPDRNVWAVPGEQIDLAFSGYGWIYRGDRETENNTVEYQRRSYEEEKTLFLFSAQQKGSRLLRFYREDAGTGRTERKSVAVHVVSEEERDRRLRAGAREGSGSSSAAGGKVASAAKGEVADLTSAGGVEVPRDGDFDTEEKSRTAENERAASLLQAAREGRLEPISTARSLMEDGEERTAEKLLRFSLERLPEEDYRRGDVLFLLGKLYEAPGPLRDERKAVEFYDRVVRRYPGSSYWQRASERSRYLKRTYIHIR